MPVGVGIVGIIGVGMADSTPEEVRPRMIIDTFSHPRAALIGNPSDGYFGKTIAFLFSEFAARVTLYHSPEIQILPNERDHSVFSSIDHLARDVDAYGYYGGVRLLKATIKVFHAYCRDSAIHLDDRNFTLRYTSDIPHSLGLAGSSAIITACMRALMAFYGIHIAPAVLANLVLSVETGELHIPAGLQDRVAQAYARPVLMDFDREIMERQGYGAYRCFPAELLPPLYIAYRTDLAETSDKLHGGLRQRWRNDDARVIAAMREWAELTEQVYELLSVGKGAEIGSLLNRNFDLRTEVCRVSEDNRELIRLARETGASAKFTGSGGAIIGTYADPESLDALRRKLEPVGVQIVVPTIVEHANDQVGRRVSGF